MKNESSRELYRYWNRIRAGNPAPRRTAIEPADIRSILADTFILELEGPDRYRFRLAGTRLCGIYGHELKGTDFLGIWNGPERSQIGALLNTISGEAAAATIGVTARGVRDRVIAMEMLLLPLIQSGPRYDRVLGSLAPMELPYWLGLDPVMNLEIGSIRLIWPDRENPVVSPIAAPTILQPRVAQRLPPERRRERFVVVEGGKSGA